MFKDSSEKTFKIQLRRGDLSSLERLQVCACWTSASEPTADWWGCHSSTLITGFSFLSTDHTTNILDDQPLPQIQERSGVCAFSSLMECRVSRLNSPVFNPIENLCSVLKRWLEKSANWSSGFSDEAGVDPANQKMCGHDRGRLLERCWCSEARTICYKLNRAAADSASSLWLVIKLSPAP